MFYISCFFILCIGIWCFKLNRDIRDMRICRQESIDSFFHYYEDLKTDFRAEKERTEKTLDNLKVGLTEIRKKSDEIFDSVKEANEESIKSNKLFQEGLSNILNYDARRKDDNG